MIPLRSDVHRICNWSRGGWGCLDNLWRIQSLNFTNHKLLIAFDDGVQGRSNWLGRNRQFDSIFGRPWCWFCKPEILDRVKARNAVRIVCFRSNGIIIVIRRHRHRIVRDFGLSQRQSTRRVRSHALSVRHESFMNILKLHSSSTVFSVSFESATPLDHCLTPCAYKFDINCILWKLKNINSLNTKKIKDFFFRESLAPKFNWKYFYWRIFYRMVHEVNQSTIKFN